jgi:hypothetical protein
MTILELATKLKVTARAMEKQNATLRDEERLRRIDPAKGGRWEVAE